jgi:hypothetical protein
MGNVTQRQLLTTMGSQFKDWADVSIEKDKLLVRTVIMKEFAESSNVRGWTTQKFSKAIKAWCHFNSFTYNPSALHNGAGRIVRKFNDKAEDMIFIMTKPIDPVKLAEMTTEAAPEDDDFKQLPLGSGKMF